MSYHKASPDVAGTIAGAPRCSYCSQPIKHLPAGQGWVHSDGHKIATTPPNEADKLIEVYHVIYDVKDAHLEDGDFRLLAYETLSWLGDMIRVLGGSVPARFDGTGR